jgi:hypothetical protein
LRRSVKIRSTLVSRRVTCTQRLDALLELLGPEWIAALDMVMRATVLLFHGRWSDHHFATGQPNAGYPSLQSLAQLAAQSREFVA